jgi:pimeloyl-ACP methyl ester carboxylesterase
VTATLFLPGISGDPAFWDPVRAQLPQAHRGAAVGWPGAGEQPSDPDVRSYADLPGLAGGTPVDLVAQSMGGWVAAALAAARPDLVRRLVLVGTSGGLDVAALGGADWRPQYREAYPDAQPWVHARPADLTAALAGLGAPVLLIWGDRDTISPPAVGERLASLIPQATLRVLPGGTHDVALEQPGVVADLITAHLGRV